VPGGGSGVIKGGWLEPDSWMIFHDFPIETSIFWGDVPASHVGFLENTCKFPIFGRAEQDEHPLTSYSGVNRRVTAF